MTALVQVLGINSEVSRNKLFSLLDTRTTGKDGGLVDGNAEGSISNRSLMESDGNDVSSSINYIMKEELNCMT